MADSPAVPCPYCAELIQPAAIKCRFCGEFLKKAPLRARPKKLNRPPDSEATMILVLGILGLVLCVFCGVVAWAKGNTYMDSCRARGVQPAGTAVAGRILGIVASSVLAVGLIGFLIAFIGGGLHRSLRG